MEVCKRTNNQRRGWLICDALVINPVVTLGYSLWPPNMLRPSQSFCVLVLQRGWIAQTFFHFWRFLEDRQEHTFALLTFEIKAEKGSFMVKAKKREQRVRDYVLVAWTHRCRFKKSTNPTTCSDRRSLFGTIAHLLLGFGQWIKRFRTPRTHKNIIFRVVPWFWFLKELATVILCPASVFKNHDRVEVQKWSTGDEKEMRVYTSHWSTKLEAYTRLFMKGLERHRRLRRLAVHPDEFLFFSKTEQTRRHIFPRRSTEIPRLSHVSIKPKGFDIRSRPSPSISVLSISWKVCLE